MRTFVVLMALVAGPGCIFGVGPYNAASAALSSSDGGAYFSKVKRGIDSKGAWVLNDSIAYGRIPVGIHWGARRGWLQDGDLTQLHVDVGAKLWKIGLGYSRLWTDALLSKGTTKYDFEGTGNGLRLSFAPLPPISLDVMLAGGTGDLKTESGLMMTTTPDATLSHRSYGLTLVPWGRGVWNIALRFDIHTIAVDGASTWGPGVDIVLTVL